MLSKQDNSNFTKDDLAKLYNLITTELNSNPPTIGIIGVSGVGKSSTLNTLFKTNLPISHTKACTKEFRAEEVGINYANDKIQKIETKLLVVDAPGLGEHINLDREYLDLYQQNLPKCDVILWVITACNRAIALDQQYLKILSDFHDKIVFGINQIELVFPGNWGGILPSAAQEKNINEIEIDRKNKIEDILGKEIKITSYSNMKKFRLQELFTSIILSCPKERAWIFDGLKNFKYDDFVLANTKLEQKNEGNLIDKIMSKLKK